MSFKDHFSTQSKSYADFRPDYPAELIDYCVSVSPRRELVWDCGAGSGQASVALAEYFDQVIATDPSENEIRNAKPHPRIKYAIAPAEKTDLPSGSADLITVAQALHWFDFEKFYAEARRVARKDAALVCWGYALASIEPTIDSVVRDFYTKTIGPFWPPERKHIDENYTTIPFPFKRVASPSLFIQREWNLEEWVGYVHSWSAVERYKKEMKKDPVPFFEQSLAGIWTETKKVKWPLLILAGRVHD